MIAALEQITAIRAGDLDELHVRDEKPPKIGTVQPVQSRVGKRASCRVRILDTWPHRDGGHMVRVEVAPREIPPRLLRPKGGYASDPRGAMKDSTVEHPTAEPGSGVPHPFLGTPSEPEGVEAETLRTFAEEAHMIGQQTNAARRLEHERRSVVERLEAAVMEREHLGLDSQRDMARLEAAIAKLERGNALARQQRTRAA